MSYTLIGDKDKPRKNPDLTSLDEMFLGIHRARARRDFSKKLLATIAKPAKGEDFKVAFNRILSEEKKRLIAERDSLTDSVTRFLNEEFPQLKKGGAIALATDWDSWEPKSDGPALEIFKISKDLVIRHILNAQIEFVTIIQGQLRNVEKLTHEEARMYLESAAKAYNHAITSTNGTYIADVRTTIATIREKHMSYFNKKLGLDNIPELPNPVLATPPTNAGQSDPIVPSHPSAIAEKTPPANVPKVTSTSTRKALGSYPREYHPVIYAGFGSVAGLATVGAGIYYLEKIRTKNEQKNHAHPAR